MPYIQCLKGPVTTPVGSINYQFVQQPDGKAVALVENLVHVECFNLPGVYARLPDDYKPGVPEKPRTLLPPQPDEDQPAIPNGVIETTRIVSDRGPDDAAVDAALAAMGLDLNEDDDEVDELDELEADGLIPPAEPVGPIADGLTPAGPIDPLQPVEGEEAAAIAAAEAAAADAAAKEAAAQAAPKKLTLKGLMRLTRDELVDLAEADGIAIADGAEKAAIAEAILQKEGE